MRLNILLPLKPEPNQSTTMTAEGEAVAELVAIAEGLADEEAETKGEENIEGETEAGAASEALGLAELLAANGLFNLSGTSSQMSTFPPLLTFTQGPSPSSICLRAARGIKTWLLWTKYKATGKVRTININKVIVNISFRLSMMLFKLSIIFKAHPPG